MKLAVISDVHSNIEALEAVLDHIALQNVERIWCLGDVVGYGPNPVECLDRVMRLDACLLGNHDQAVLCDPEDFSSGAERAVFWTRERLRDGGADADAQRARWDFLAELPRSAESDGLFFVHGSVRDPLSEYVFPEDVYNTRKIEKVFAMLRTSCLHGHSHVAGVVTAGCRYLSPADLDNRFRFGDEKVMVNVGSVGQPRDGDPRASYVTVQDGQVAFHRVDYPFERTIEKIHAIEPLDNFLGDRLREGR